jgi:hypothetical protein
MVVLAFALQDQIERITERLSRGLPRGLGGTVRVKRRAGHEEHAITQDRVELAGVDETEHLRGSDSEPPGCLGRRQQTIDCRSPSLADVADGGWADSQFAGDVGLGRATGKQLFHRLVTNLGQRGHALTVPFHLDGRDADALEWSYRRSPLAITMRWIWLVPS